MNYEELTKPYGKARSLVVLRLDVSARKRHCSLTRRCPSIQLRFQPGWRSASLSPGAGLGTQPAAYLRATRALDGPAGTARESEAALGLSARPIAAVPIAAHLELRAREAGGKIDIRPSAFAVTEISQVGLPLGAHGEVYAQAGYVGGEFATGFVDGQARVTREALSVGQSKLNIGGGAWGGAQKGASRLDVGPSASVHFRVGSANARAQLDYRVRVAGDAAPDDGVALTLSAGF